jgi:hypothetical protein
LNKGIFIFCFYSAAAIARAARRFAGKRFNFAPNIRPDVKKRDENYYSDDYCLKIHNLTKT